MKSVRSNLPGSTLHLFVTGFVGFLFFVVGQWLYPMLTVALWQPLGIALYFLGFALVVYVTMFVLNQIRGDYSFWVMSKKLDDWKSSYKIGILCVSLIFLLSGVFEFVYELGSDQIGPATSYVFVIDDSGSMSANDSQQKRAIAIETIMKRESSTMPYAVYGFTTDVVLLKEMAPYSPSDSFTFESSGGTDILGALNGVLDDLSSGRLQGGSAPRILLLSDGESSSLGWRQITNDSRNCNAIISAIGFGYDSALLRNIAERTGGVFVQVDDIDDLPTQMGTAITAHASRNLISSRTVFSRDLLYAIMRVVFLSLVGVVWSWMKYETYCSAKAEVNRWVFTLSLILCTLASILLEVFLQRLWMPPAVARLVFCVLWAITPGFFMEHHSSDETSSHADGRPWGDVKTGLPVEEYAIRESDQRSVGDYTLIDYGTSSGSAAWDGNAGSDGFPWDASDEPDDDADRSPWN